jgi:DNA-binding MarR family transcriptional regulator
MNRKLNKGQHVVNIGRSSPRTSEGEAFAMLAIRVMMTAGYLTEAGDALTKPLGQSSARWQVLAGAAKGDMSVAQIARALGVSRQAVQRLADLLEADGLARYVENPAHLRAKLLALTPGGRATLDAIRARQTVWANALGAEFTTTELLQAKQTIDKLLTLLKARNPELS